MPGSAPIQSDQFDTTATVTVLLVSSTLAVAPLIRLNVEPSASNGLRERSQVMVDKAMTVKRDKLGSRLGPLDDDALVAVMCRRKRSFETLRFGGVELQRTFIVARAVPHPLETFTVVPLRIRLLVFAILLAVPITMRM